MDKTKRTLGSRRTSSKRETNDVKPTSSACDSEQPLGSASNSTKGELHKSKQNGMCQPSTPKRESLGKKVKLESPALASPLQSPGYAAMIPKSLGSPEIEVSWDWGCSQAHREMLPPRSKKKIKTHQSVPVLAPSGTHYGPVLKESQMSEEENQERLAFYKNILLRSINHDIHADPRRVNNSLENEGCSFSSPTNFASPKQSTPNKCEDQINAFFDDSANDLIFECSQAVEEKIAKGEIDVENSNNVNILNPNQPLCTSSENGHINKKVCYGKPKLNLFPENLKRKECNSAVNSRKNECYGVSPTQSNRSNRRLSLKPTNLIESLNGDDENVSTQALKQADMFNKKLSGQSLKSSLLLNNNFQKSSQMSDQPSNYEEQSCCSKQGRVLSHISAATKLTNSRAENEGSNKNERLNIHLTVNNNEFGRIKTFDKSPDVKSLLEDEFDNELSSIDFDSLCHNGMTSGSHSLDTAAKSSMYSQTFSQKICSQQEIEKKRLEALNRLNRKKRGGLV